MVILALILIPLLEYCETPVLDISNHPLPHGAGVRLLVKREDLNHPDISGNKWWKLKYNLQEALRLGHDTLLTFGGAYSNHIYATAAAARISGLKSIAIVRGEEVLPLNATLSFAVKNGMRLEYCSRSEYRALRTSADQLDNLRNRLGSFYLIPEGGTNPLAVKGTEAFGKIIDKIPADYICVPVGTAGTIAGLLRSVSPEKQVLGFSVLKNGSFLKDIIESYAGGRHNNWRLLTEYSYGGYGKRNEEVSTFIKSFLRNTNIPLDFVYTGKMMCAVFDLITKGYFEKGKTILVIHTGGLQGHS